VGSGPTRFTERVFEPADDVAVTGFTGFTGHRPWSAPARELNGR
jgi:hypothetical protein